MWNQKKVLYERDNEMRKCNTITRDGLYYANNVTIVTYSIAGKLKFL